MSDLVCTFLSKLSSRESLLAENRTILGEDDEDESESSSEH